MADRRGRTARTDRKVTRALDYIGAGEVARLLGLSDSRIRQLALAGELVEADRIGGRRLYKRADVERWLRARRPKPGRPKVKRRRRSV